MIAPVPRIGRLAFASAGLLLALAGCVTEEYNPQETHAEEDGLADVVQLTRPAGPAAFARAGQGRLSPDQQWVVFRGDRGGPGTKGVDAGYGLYVARVRWSGDRGSPDRHIVRLDRPFRITRLGVECGAACFSPDGFSLAFVAAATGRPDRRQLFRADGWEQAVAMTDVTRGVDLVQHPVTDATLNVFECDWSPDGKSICLSAAPAEGWSAAGLYAMRPDGSRLIRLTDAQGHARSPAFSPDGRRLLYRGDPTRPSGPSQVFVADVVHDLAGDVIGLRDAKPLTSEAGVASSCPCWLGRDGRHVVYATNRHGARNAELYVMDAGGLRKTRLTFSPGPDLLPWVSTEGLHLLWTSARPADAEPQLFAAEVHLPPGS